MIKKLLKSSEARTLEFKENAKPLNSIVKTVTVFSNTADGALVIGIRDKTCEIIGLDNPLEDEERVVSSSSDQIAPLFIPNISIVKLFAFQLLPLKYTLSTSKIY